jgi:hypothetical protein
MKATNENLLRGCIQEAQYASTSLTQAISGIEASAVPNTTREAQAIRLLKANAQAINMLLGLFELTGAEAIPIWPT